MATDSDRAAKTHPTLMITVATVGFAVNVIAWVLVGALGERLGDRYGLGPVSRAAVVALPLVVGSLGRIPVGMLTDRYGARLMFPLVSLATGGAVLLLGVAGSALALAAVAVALGVAGTAFAVGAALVGRCSSPERRGFGLSVFGAGIGGGAVAAGAISPLLEHVPLRGATEVLATILAGYAVVAALLIRDAPAPAQHLPVLRTALATLRLPAVRQWCVLYAVACGLLVAMALHLPTYLHLAYGRGWAEAALDTAVFVGVAAACRPLGGWLAQHHRPVPVLVAAYAPTGVLGVLLAFVPALPITTAALIAVGVALGTAGGVLLFLVGRAVPPDRAGLVTGVVGAAGGLGGLIPPLVLGVVYDIERSFAIGLMVLSGVALAAAAYLRARGEWRDPLAYPVPRPAPAVEDQAELAGVGTAVVALAATDTADGGGAVIATLAEIATRQELIVVYGHQPPPDRALSPPELLAAVRGRLPRHKVAAVLVDARDPDDPACEVIDQLLEDGSVAMAVVPAADPAATAALLADRLGADGAFQLAAHPVHGAVLRPLGIVRSGDQAGAAVQAARR